MTTATTKRQMTWRLSGMAALVAAAVAGAFPAASPASAATVTTGIAPTVMINEVSVANQSGAADEQGKRGDWVELYNTTASAVDLTGWGLSNTAKSPFRWVFPSGTQISSHGYLRVWADKMDRTSTTANLHTNFNIDNGSDSVVLTAPNQTTLGQVVDSTTPPRGQTDVSWCRVRNGDPASPYAWCLAPTAGAANSGTTAEGLLSTPVISLASGVYGAAQTVTVTRGTAAADAGAELRYTTDGSAPSAASTLVTGPITVSATTTLRVAAFKSGVLPSYAATATYVIDSTGKYAGQRLVFVTMAPADRTSFKAGGSAPAYGWKSNVELITPTGVTAFNADAWTEQAGQLGSRNGQQTLPLEINFNDAMGTKSVSYPIFSAKPAQTSYKKLRLRNAGDDYQEAHLRDQYWQAVGTEARLMPAAYEPAQVFLDGVYYGAMDLREKEDETLAESSFGVDKDDVEFRSDTRIVAGDNTNTDFASTYNYISGTSMSVAANYEKATSLLDVTNFAQDFAIHMFAIDRDWQWRNMHAVRMPSYDGKWRYRIHDVDISSDGTNAWGFDTKTSSNANSLYCCHESGTMMKSLLANPTFKNLYANVIADQLNTVLSPAESTARLDAMAASLAPYIPNQVAANGQPTSVAKWTTEVARLRTFLTERGAYYEKDTKSYLGLTDRVPVTVGVDDSAKGTVVVNTVDLTTRMKGAGATWTGSYWPAIPVTLTAKPQLGYAFAGWSDGVTTASRTVAAGSGITYRATFTPLATVPAPSVTAVANRTDVTGKVVSVQVQGTDPTGYALTWSAKSLPSGLNIHPETGLIYGKPTRAGVFASTITASNGKAKTTVAVTWTVTNQLDRLVTLPTMITGNGTGLKAVWSNDATNGGTAAVTQTGVAPAVSVGSGSGPFAGYQTSNWSVRFTGFVTAPVTGQYSLRATLNADDGARVLVNGTSVIDAWTSNATTPSGTVTLQAGVPTPITIEFWDKSGAASLSMSWLLPGATAYSALDKGVLDPA